jgi:PhnB protein
MLKFNPYLSFDGQCEEAFKLYEKCLRGKITFITTYGESPGSEKMPSDMSKRIMHVTLTVGDQVLQGADVPSGQYQKPQGLSISLQLNDAVEAGRIFEALAENGTVQMPLQETFWALRFGMVTDRFSTPWLINCDKPA